MAGARLRALALVLAVCSSAPLTLARPSPPSPPAQGAAACGSPTCAASPSNCPTDNPVDTLYGAGAYPWTSSIAWSCAYHIADFANNISAAAQAAAAAGGGTVYIPPGSHALDGTLYLPSSVVLRGAPTTQPAVVGRAFGPLSPASRLVCPPLTHAAILNDEPDAANLGVVALDLDGCAVLLWPRFEGAGVPASWDFKRSWVYATNVTGMGRNKLVLSSRVHDVSLSDPNVPWHAYTTNNTWPYSYGVAVSVYSDENALVANTQVPPADPSRAFNVTLLLNVTNPGKGQPVQRVIRDVPYLADNRYGIDVCNFFTRKACAANCGGDQPVGDWRPQCCPWEFRSGLVVRDNAAFVNGRTAFTVSGGAPNDGGGGDGTTARGSGTQFVGNLAVVRPNTTCWSHDGVFVMTGADTNENRAVEFAGYFLNISGNQGFANRQAAADSPYRTVDGEGILLQNYDATSGIGNVIANNDFSSPVPTLYGPDEAPETGFVCFYDLEVVVNNTVTGNSVIPSEYIGAFWHNYIHNGTAVGNVCEGNSQPCVGMDGPTRKAVRG